MLPGKYPREKKNKILHEWETLLILEKKSNFVDAMTRRNSYLELRVCFSVLFTRYVQIMQEDGMEISQPALDPASNIHHGITIRKPDSRSHK